MAGGDLPWHDVGRGVGGKQKSVASKHLETYGPFDRHALLPQTSGPGFLESVWSPPPLPSSPFKGGAATDGKTAAVMPMFDLAVCDDS